VWRTRVGYAGGTTDSPTYDAIGDHVESVEVLYDPKVVTYDELLDLFWRSHDPAGKPYVNQYSSLILTTSDAQASAAQASAARYEQARGHKVATRIEKVGRFYPAEDYHQKYYVRQDQTLSREFRTVFGEDQTALRDSAAAARLNGYVAGYGTPAQLAEEIDSLGLSLKAREYLRSRVGDGTASGACAVTAP